MTNTTIITIKGMIFMMALVLAASVALATSKPADAYENTPYDLPNLYGTDGDVVINIFQTPGQTDGRIFIDARQGYYSGMYVQARPIYDNSLLNDGRWKRATNNMPLGRAYWQDWGDYTYYNCMHTSLGSVGR